jgi:SGNH hydrolase-like domain, acetyltransferase AlgX
MATEGFIDGLKGPFLLGWAFDPERPDDRLELDVELDGQPVGRCIADVLRRDLEQHSVGDGRHGFRVRLPRPLEPGSSHLVLVRSEDGTVLPIRKRYFADPSGQSTDRQLNLYLAPLEQADADSGSQPTDGEVANTSAGETGALVEGSAATAPLSRPRADARRALVGRDGWLFAYDGPERLARTLGITPPLPARTRDQVRLLRSRYKRLTDMGVGYLVAAMPDKLTVCSERLPAGVEFVPDGRPADRLVGALRNDPALEILDLLPVLRHARHHGELFFRQGRQLTWTGAFHAYRAVAKELAKRFAQIEPPTTTLELGEPVEAGDPLRSLPRVALVGEEPFPVAVDDESADQEPDLNRSRLSAMYAPLPDEIATGLGPRAALLERDENSDLPRAMIVHDGSGGRLVPFLAEHFSSTLVEVSDTPPYEVIDRQRPLVVIQIVSESGSFFA